MKVGKVGYPTDDSDDGDVRIGISDNVANARTEGHAVLDGDGAGVARRPTFRLREKTCVEELRGDAVACACRTGVPGDQSSGSNSITVAFARVRERERVKAQLMRR